MPSPATRAGGSWWARRALGLALLLVQASCTSLGYVRQAAGGQYDLITRARPIDELVAAKRVDPRTRFMLSHVASIKQFGERHGLAATPNYTKYVRVDRPYIVWVTSASDPLKFHSKSWTFPLVGSFTYLGWFNRADAYTFAADVQREGLDVDVRGSTAYSTAGFFEDAVLSTMMRKGKAGLGDLTNTVLHEMTHATFFVRHQSTLNESVANFVGDHLAEVYLREELGEDAEETVAYLAAKRVSDERGRAMRAAYRSLEVLYASKKPDREKLADKGALLGRLHDELHFRRPINNATLIQYKTYHSGQEELASLLAACGGSFPDLLRTLDRLETQTFPKSQEKEIGPIVLPLLATRCR